MEKTKAPKLITVAIFTTITVVFWVFMSLYSIITSTPPASVDPELLIPLNPALDLDALSRLEGRIFFEQGETSSPVIIREEPLPEPRTEESETTIINEENNKENEDEEISEIF